MENKNTRRGFTQTAVNNTVILNLIQDLQRLPLQLLNNLRGRFQIKFGMTSLFNHGAFTLIELLVVVLIIGILAAVAVPQYQKAVWKSRISETLPILKALGNAEQIYRLANGEYTLDSTALDIAIGETNGNNTSVQLLPNWSFKLYEIADQSIYAQSRIVLGMYVYYYLDKNAFHCCFNPSDEKAKQICSSFSAGAFSTCTTDPNLSCYQIN